MSEAIQDAIDAAPAGTSGLVCEPWTPGEVYGVAADWAQASSPVRIYGEDGWAHDGHGRQVADFRHNDRDALVSELTEALMMSGEDEPEEEAERLANDAISFGK